MLEEPDYYPYETRPYDDEPEELCDLCDDVAEHVLERFGVLCDRCLWRVSGVAQ